MKMATENSVAIFISEKNIFSIISVTQKNQKWSPYDDNGLNSSRGYNSSKYIWHAPNIGGSKYIKKYIQKI